MNIKSFNKVLLFVLMIALSSNCNVFAKELVPPTKSSTILSQNNVDQLLGNDNKVPATEQEIELLKKECEKEIADRKSKGLSEDIDITKLQKRLKLEHLKIIKKGDTDTVQTPMASTTGILGGADFRNPRSIGTTSGTFNADLYFYCLTPPYAITQIAGYVDGYTQIIPSSLLYVMYVHSYVDERSVSYRFVGTFAVGHQGGNAYFSGRFIFNFLGSVVGSKNISIYRY